MAFRRGTARHLLEVEQAGTSLRGIHRILHGESALEGTIHARSVALSSRHRYEGTNLSYAFTGEIDGETMRGTVRLGSTGNSAPGPVNEREYGEASWTASRAGARAGSKVGGTDGEHR